jgi:hypothetical protein
MRAPLKVALAVALLAAGTHLAGAAEPAPAWLRGGPHTTCDG